MPDPIKPRHFKTPAAFASWLARNHASKTELWIGFHKKASGRGGMVYKQALDEALCWGWIDGLVKSIDADSYMQRFTPRKKDSHWSLVNVRRFGELDAAGRIHPAGRAAFGRRTAERTGKASFETPEKELTPAMTRQFRANKKAWEFWEEQPRGYRRLIKHWVTTAKQEETRARRLARLIEYCGKRERIPPFAPPPARRS